jgi:hypothetical protein
MLLGGGKFALNSFSLSTFSQRLLKSLRYSTMGEFATQKVDTSHRLAALRALMSKKENNVSVLVVPSEDQRTLSSLYGYFENLE